MKERQVNGNMTRNMDIDEAIAHEREVETIHRNNNKLNETLGANSPYYNTDCLKCAEEHEQIAEWLELLKWYQQGMEDIPSESGVLPKDVYHAGYNKAIDDFVNACKEDILCQSFGLHANGIERIAEQLKAGGENDD